MTPSERDKRARINELVEAVRSDRERSNELFHYVWTMICVRRGLMRVVRQTHVSGRVQLSLEEIRTGRTRVVYRPAELDPDIEDLAIDALARILGHERMAG
jgi:hypothetical protein